MPTLRLIALVLLVYGQAAAAVALGSPFTDHAVLQRDLPVPVWGTEDPGKTVTVSIQGKTASGVAGTDGRWKVVLPALSVGGPYDLTVTGTSTVTVTDLLVGEVWLCSGQSNMGFTLKQVDQGEAEVAAADHPRIRLFSVKRNPQNQPQTTCGGTWKVCAPATAKDFSAVGYFFGRELERELDVPVGLFDSSWGGTDAEAWTSQQALEAVAEFKPLMPAWDAILAEYPAKFAEYQAKELPKWEAACAEAKAAGKPLPKKPKEPSGPNTLERRPAGLYNGMIAPLVPYAIRGAIWYQGENNARPPRDEAYRRLLPVMIADWRSAFGREFSFHIVQLANFGKDNPATVAQPWPAVPWALVREGQALVAATVPACGLAVTIDIGNPTDIHPTNKQEVGRRLALCALAKDYGKDVAYAGPVATGLVIDGSTATVTFDHAQGLAAKGGDVKGFMIAGEDGMFVAAQAVISGTTVKVSSPSVVKPVAVRYDWANSPDGNLVNGAGLPAGPFRFPLR